MGIICVTRYDKHTLLNHETKTFSFMSGGMCDIHFDSSQFQLCFVRLLNEQHLPEQIPHCENLCLHWYQSQLWWFSKLPTKIQHFIFPLFMPFLLCAGRCKATKHWVSSKAQRVCSWEGMALKWVWVIKHHQKSFVTIGQKRNNQ